MTRTRARITYLALALLTVALGLCVHLGGAALGADVRDILGDALWAAMMLWWVSVLLPDLALTRRTVLAFGICVAVELSQLVHAPALDAVRGTMFGRLVLGSGFDPRDLVAYACGVLAAALVDWMLHHRRAGRVRMNDE